MIPSAIMPTMGAPKMSSNGMNPIRPRPIPAKEPRRPACGTTFCTQLPKKEKKVKKAHEGGEHEGVAEVKTSKRPGKKAKKHVAHAHAKKAAPKKAAAKKKKK